MELLVLIVAATIAYTFFETFASLAGNKVDANLSSVIFNGLGALIPLAAYFFLRFYKKAEVITATTSGMAYSVLAGISIAVFSILLIKIFEKGGLSYVVPLIYGGTVVLAALIGWLFLKESFNLVHLLGIAIISLGIGLVVYAKV